MEEKSNKEKNIFLFPANFETFDFESLIKENDSEDYEGILWSNSEKNSYKRNVKIKKGDIVYAYYTNLPDNINRILLEFEVIDAYEKGVNEECFYYENDKEKEEMIKNPNKRKPGVRLKLKDGKGVLSYKVDKLEEDKVKFSEKNLRKKYGFNNFQGKQYINKKHEDLIHDLEKETKRYTLKDLTDYMNRISQCALQNSQKFKHENHTTFVKENGLNYYEQHHLIQQFKGRENKELKNIIDNKANLINLCPNCHRRIHNGKIEDRKNMVIELYDKIKQKNEDFDSRLSQILKIKNDDKTIINWILEQYKAKKQDKDI